MSSTTDAVIQDLAAQKYKYGFTTEIEMEEFPKGLSPDIVRMISAKKGEPAWLLEWRLKAYEAWLKMEEPSWARIHHAPIDYQDLYYYAAPAKAA